MIELQFSAQDNLPSEIIKLFGHGPWSHVDAVLPDGRLLGARSDVRAGVPAGVQIRPPGYAPFSRTLHASLPGNDGEFYAFLHSQLGKPYDHDAIVAFAVGRNWRDQGAWFCSELQAASLENCAYFRWPLSTPENKLTPDDLLLAISATEKVG